MRLPSVARVLKFPGRAGPIAGFTLIEILVVIVILAITVSVAVVNFNLGGRDDQLEREARRLLQLQKLAADKAIFGAKQYGVRFTQRGYAFYSLEEKQRDSEQSGDLVELVWRVVQGDKQLRQREWPEGVLVDVYVDGIAIALDAELDQAAEAQSDDLKPHWQFLSNGESLPSVEVRLSSRDAQTSWRVAVGDEGLLIAETLKAL